MKILGFDTSHGKCSVAISDHANIISTSSTRTISIQAETLVNLIEEALSKACLTYRDIDYLAVTTGPGSFTGIRIGLAAASGIVLASGIKPISLSNFDVTYFRICEQVRNFHYAIVVINAYRGQVYVQTYDHYGNIHKSAEMIDIEELSLYITNINELTAIAGSGLQYIAGNDMSHIVQLPRFANPDARTICRLAHAKITAANISGALEPLYIRLPDAKVSKIK